MFERLDRLRAERDRAYRKRDEWDAKGKELERRCTEEEKLTVHQLLSEAGMTPEELAALLRRNTFDRVAQHGAQVMETKEKGDKVNDEDE